MSQIDKEIAYQLKDWNPMREAYNDSSFNKYVSGPGADLEDNMQPSELAKNQSRYKNNPDPYLMFRNVPTNLSVEGLKNMCSRHGNVLRANKSSGGLYYVNFATINDMERAFSGLQNNEYGFNVYLGKPKEEKSHTNINGPLPNLASFPSNRIDYDRSYKISSVNPSRPYFNKNPFVSKEDYDNTDNLLSVVDPQRHFLIEEDAYDLDRVDYHKKPVIKNGNYSYYTGRAYYLMPEKDKRFVEEKQRNTIGVYNGVEEKFSNPLPQVCKQIQFGPCESCEKDCDMICARCSAFFCSVECQTKEWQNHRYVCGKPPDFMKPPAKPLKRMVETQTSLSDKHDPTQAAALKLQIPESGATVILTAITKTNVAFVRSTAVGDMLKFFETVSTIQKEAKLQRPLHHTPKKGEIVFTKFKDDQFNRAMVLNADDLEHIKVVYVDYGNIDSKKIDELFHAPDIFWKLPRMAVPVTLKDVPDFYMNDEVKMYMYAHLNTDMKIVYNEDDIIKNKSEVIDVIKSVDLFDSKTNESYNKTIASFMVTPEETKKSAVVYQEHLEQSPLPVGENIPLVIMDNSELDTGFISCTTLEYAQAIQKFQEVIQAFFEKQTDTKPYTPRVKELCIAKYPGDDHWYRAKCIEVVGDGHPSLLFIDYGNLAFVKVEDIRKYPQEFTFPMLTHDCEIVDPPKIVDKKIQYKMEDTLVIGSEVVCNKVELKDGFYLVHLDDVLRKYNLNIQFYSIPSSNI